MSARFDWYTASISAEPSEVITRFESSFDLSDLQENKKKNGYERAYNFVRGSTVLARIQFGGSSVGGNVWAASSGDTAPDFSDVVRAHYPSHSLLRADVAIDYDEPGAWDSLSSLAITTADAFGLKVRHVGDFHREQDGRTLYIGSRSSAAMQRLYEKGKQLGGSVDWVRAELELKPQNNLAKAAYASASPEQMFLATKWPRCIWEALNGPTQLLRPCAPGSVRVKSDDERALDFMSKQYGNVLRRKLESLGGDVEAFGLFVAGLIG